MRKADTSAVRGAAMRKALQPFNGLRVLSAVHIMVRTAYYSALSYLLCLACSSFWRVGSAHCSIRAV
jgi:hypothetical protein